jgi:hypothetical protein
MSEWYYQQDRRLGGPISFKGLARLVVDEELHDTDVVCRSGEFSWQAISSIVGLRRTCEIMAGERHYVPPTAAEIAESGIYPISPEEIRRQAAAVAYEQMMDDSPRPSRKKKRAGSDGTGRPTSREYLTWGVVMLGAMAAGALLYDQIFVGQWNHPTYERSQ